MTEAEWFACKDPDSMLECVQHTASDRQFRLFLCACCRRFLPLLTGELAEAAPLCTKAVDVAERFADGLATEEERATTLPETFLLSIDVRCILAGYAVHNALYLRIAGDPRPMRFGKRAMGHAASEGAEFARGAVGVIDVEQANATGKDRTAMRRAATIQEKRAQVQFLHDIFGNPFRPHPPEKGKREWTARRQQWLAWNAGAIAKLAQTIYDDRAFERLPLLGDALEEVGCTDTELLDHCRQPGEHIRGCWMVDLLLESK